MPLEIKKAKKSGAKTKWTAGDVVIVKAVNEDDPENVEAKEYQYTFDGSMTPAQFKVMVKREVKAHIKHLTNKPTYHDIASTIK